MQRVHIFMHVFTGRTSHPKRFSQLMQKAIGHDTLGTFLPFVLFELIPTQVYLLVANLL